MQDFTICQYFRKLSIQFLSIITFNNFRFQIYVGTEGILPFLYFIIFDNFFQR